MPLSLVVGQYSDKGRKPSNQDFHGACLPRGHRLDSKGVAVALADGISSSPHARQASQAAVTSFLEDYYCTSDAWSVRRSVDRVLAAANSWLFAQTQQGQGRYDKDRGWTCTFSAMVFRSRTAHLFHVGDARVYQVQGRTLEQLTTDHRVHVGGGQSYLGRAFGIGAQVEVDYRTVPLEAGDTFVLATDGVHAFVRPPAMVALIEAHRDDLDRAATAIADAALQAGSDDNLTVQVVRVDTLPPHEPSEVARQAAELAPAPELRPGLAIDGWQVVRELHGGSRSHVYLAIDAVTQQPAVLKVPATEVRHDPAQLERFLLEEWIARRVDSPHLLKPCAIDRPRSALYVAMEYVEGHTLTQWMADHPHPSLEEVRGIVEQAARGLRALHRGEMLHQDLRPDNVMVDRTGTVKVIDFGAVHVAGLADPAASPGTLLQLPGTAQYMAPEYFLGQPGTQRSDLFSLAVIAYQLLTGNLPYGMEVAKCRNLADQKRLRYRSLLDWRKDLPAWVDEALRRALQVEPARRPADVAEFIFALRHPGQQAQARPLALVERDPVAVWRGLAIVLGVTCCVLAYLLSRH